MYTLKGKVLVLSIFVFLLVLIIPFTVGAFSTTIINDNFESYSNGSYSSLNSSDGSASWSWSSSGSNINIENDGAGKILKTTGTAYFSSPAILSTGIINLEVKAKTSLGIPKEIRLNDSSNKIIFSIRLSSNSIIYSQEINSSGSSSADITETGLTNNSWYYIKISCDLDQRLCNVYYGLDPSKMKQLGVRALRFYANGSAPYTTTNSFKYLYIGSGSTTTYPGYFDDVILSYEDGKYISSVDVVSPRGGIIVPSFGTKTLQYSAKVLDNKGEEVKNEPVVWSISPVTPGVSIDQNGLLTVDRQAPIGQIDVIAASSTKPNIKNFATLKLADNSPCKIIMSDFSPLRIPNSDENPTSYKKSYNILNYDDEILYDYSVIISLQPAEPNIWLYANPGTITIGVNSNVAPGSYSLLAKVSGYPEVTLTKTIEVQRPTPTTIKLFGNNSVIASSTSTVSTAYSALVYDQFECPVKNPTVNWSIKNNIDANIENGLLTVKANAIATDIELTASCGNVFTSKIIQISYRPGIPVKLELATPYSVELPNSTTQAVKNNAFVYDAKGALLNDVALNWSIVGDDLGCRLNRQGILYIYPNSRTGSITIKTTLQCDPSIYKQEVIEILPAKNENANPNLSLRGYSDSPILQSKDNRILYDLRATFIADIIIPKNTDFFAGAISITPKDNITNMLILDSDMHAKYIPMASEIDTDTGMASTQSTGGELIRANYGGRLAYVGYENGVAKAIYRQLDSLPGGYTLKSINNAVYNKANSTLGNILVDGAKIIHSKMQEGITCIGDQCIGTDKSSLIDGNSYNISVICNKEGTAISVVVFGSTYIPQSSLELKASFLKDIRIKQGELYCDFIENGSSTIRKVLMWAKINSSQPSDIYNTIHLLTNSTLLYTVDSDGAVNDIYDSQCEFNNKLYKKIRFKEARASLTDKTLGGYNVGGINIYGYAYQYDYLTNSYAFINPSLNSLSFNELSESSKYDADVIVNTNDNSVFYAFVYGLFKKPDPASIPGMVVDCKNNMIMLYTGSDFIQLQLSDAIDYTAYGISDRRNNILLKNGTLIQYGTNKDGQIDSIRELSYMDESGNICLEQMPIAYQNSSYDYVKTYNTKETIIDGFTKCSEVLGIQNGISFYNETEVVALEPLVPVYYCNIKNMLEGQNGFCGFTDINTLEIGKNSDDMLFIYKFAGRTVCVVILDKEGDNNVICKNAYLDSNTYQKPIAEGGQYGIFSDSIATYNNRYIVTLLTNSGDKNLYLSPSVNFNGNFYAPDDLIDNLKLDLNTVTMPIKYELDDFGDIYKITTYSEGVRTLNGNFLYNSTASTLGNYAANNNTDVFMINTLYPKYSCIKPSQAFSSNCTYYCTILLENNIVKVVAYKVNFYPSYSTPPLLVTSQKIDTDSNGMQSIILGGYYGRTVSAFRSAAGMIDFSTNTIATNSLYQSISNGSVCGIEFNSNGELKGLKQFFNLREVDINNSALYQNTGTLVIRCGYIIAYDSASITINTNKGGETLSISSPFIYNYNSATQKISYTSINNIIAKNNYLAVLLKIGSSTSIYLIDGPSDISDNYLTTIPLPGSSVAGSVEYTRSQADMPDSVSLITACYSRDNNNVYKLVAISCNKDSRYVAKGQTIKLTSLIEVPEKTSRIKAFLLNDTQSAKALCNPVAVQWR